MIKAIGGKKSRVQFSDLLLDWRLDSDEPDDRRRRSMGSRMPDVDDDEDD